MQFIYNIHIQNSSIDYNIGNLKLFLKTKRKVKTIRKEKCFLEEFYRFKHSPHFQFWRRCIFCHSCNHSCLKLLTCQAKDCKSKWADNSLSPDTFCCLIEGPYHCWILFATFDTFGQLWQFRFCTGFCTVVFLENGVSKNAYSLYTFTIVPRGK